MPGDPLRARRIADDLLDDVEQVTDTRGMLGFTGTVDGQALSVMGSGMGMPSATLYATELFDAYGVERIARVGTCGGIAPSVEVGDVIVVTGAHTDSSMNEQRLPGLHFSAVASFELVAAAVQAGSAQDVAVHVGSVVTKDHFYLDAGGPELLERMRQYGVLGVEMESAGLFATAAEFGRQAVTVLTVSDHLVNSGGDMTARERETRFESALQLAVAAALA